MNLAAFSTAESIDSIKKWEKNIEWSYLCMNPNDWVIDYMKQNINKIDWKSICKNENQRIVPEFIEPFLSKRKLEIDFSELCRRSYAVDFFKSNPHLIDIYSLVENPNPEAITLIDHYLEFNVYSPALLPAGNRASEYSTTFHLDYAAHNPGSLLEENSSRRLKVKACDIPIQIVQNENAMHHVNRFYKNIDNMEYEMAELFWYYLGVNVHPDAVKLAANHLEKINMELFSQNAGIMAIGEWTDDLIDRICWNTVVFNPKFPEIIEKMQERKNVKELLFDNVDVETLSKSPKIVKEIQSIFPDFSLD